MYTKTSKKIPPYFDKKKKHPVPPAHAAMGQPLAGMFILKKIFSVHLQITKL